MLWLPQVPPAVAQPLAALPPYGCGIPLAGAAPGFVRVAALSRCAALGSSAALEMRRTPCGYCPHPRSSLVPLPSRFGRCIRHRRCSLAAPQEPAQDPLGSLRLGSHRVRPGPSLWQGHAFAPIWSHRRESNPRSQFGRLVYCRCTTAAYIPPAATGGCHGKCVEKSSGDLTPSGETLRSCPALALRAMRPRLLWPDQCGPPMSHISGGVPDTMSVYSCPTCWRNPRKEDAASVRHQRCQRLRNSVAAPVTHRATGPASASRGLCRIWTDGQGGSPPAAWDMQRKEWRKCRIVQTSCGRPTESLAYPAVSTHDQAMGLPQNV